MFQTLFLAHQNLGDYLSLSRSHCLKRYKRCNQTRYGCWHTLPDDIMRKIVQHLDVPDRIRLSVVCKSWSSVAKQKDIPSAQLPWLALPYSPYSNYLRFSSLSEGKVVELKLPKPAQGGMFLASSKGWLVMANGLNRDEMFLLNPITGVQHQLPSLESTRSFQKFVETEECFLPQVVLSSSNISECMVAAVFHSFKELGLCMPGDKSWSVFPLLDEVENLHFEDILFSGGMLYALVNSPGINNGVVTACTLNFGDQDREVELKLVYDKKENWSANNENYEIRDDYRIALNSLYYSCLLESTNKEVLLVHKIYDTLKFAAEYEALIVEAEDHDWENASYQFQYAKSSGFAVYKIDPENGNFLRVQSLGDQTLFLADYGSSLSLSSSDCKGLEENCIYFGLNGILKLLPPQRRRSTINREIGIFYLDGGKIQRSFPSVEVLNTQVCSFSWFSPSF